MARSRPNARTRRQLAPVGLAAAPAGSGVKLALGVGAVALLALMVKGRTPAAPPSNPSNNPAPKSQAQQQAESVLGTSNFSQFRLGRAVAPIERAPLLAALQSVATSSAWKYKMQAAPQYVDAIIAGAAKWRVPTLAVAAIIGHESRYGLALTPPNAGGSGDFGAREMGSRSKPPAGCKVVTKLPAGWSIGRVYSKDGTSRPAEAPWYIPSDESGFGKGLAQLDLVGCGCGLDTVNWRDATINIGKCAEVLSIKRNYLAGKFPQMKGADLIVASIAAYNRGEGTVATDISAGRGPDNRGEGNYLGYTLPIYAALEDAYETAGGSQISV